MMDTIDQIFLVHLAHHIGFYKTRGVVQAMQHIIILISDMAVGKRSNAALSAVGKNRPKITVKVIAHNLRGCPKHIRPSLDCPCP